jgi:hypothetical protein
VMSDDENAKPAQGYHYDSSAPKTGFVGMRAPAEELLKRRLREAQRNPISTEPAPHFHKIGDDSTMSYAELKRLLWQEQERSLQLIQLLSQANARMEQMVTREELRLMQVNEAYKHELEEMFYEKQNTDFLQSALVLTNVIEAARKSASSAVKRAEQNAGPKYQAVRRTLTDYAQRGEN